MNAEKEMQTVETQALTPMDMLNMAVRQNADLAKLEKLMELQERWEKNEARKAYVTAMNAFKANPPTIYKTKHVSFETTKGTTEYHHALLDNATDVLGAALTKHGLSFRWDCEQIGGGLIKVTCVVTHVMGHSERVSLQAGLDQSGGKNNIQALGSSVTYLQRYTLFAATGMAAKGKDNDGRTVVEYITDKQAADLTALIEEVGGDKKKFCTLFKIDSIKNLPIQAWKHAVETVEARRKK